MLTVQLFRVPGRENTGVKSYCKVLRLGEGLSPESTLIERAIDLPASERSH